MEDKPEFYDIGKELDRIDKVEVWRKLDRIESNQMLTIVAICLFGLIWAFNKLFPIVMTSFVG